ncbi:MAG: NB-ARC domain-containing protein, partial [Acidimicrobiales bacterium]
DAVAWCGELQAAWSTEPWPEGIEIRPRIGVHTGEAEERGSDYFGPAVNVAARLADAGHGGQTLVSGATCMMLDRRDLRDLGMFRLGGVVSDQHIFQLGDGEHPPLRTEDSRQGNIPQRVGRLLGRGEALEIVGEALAKAPIVTLVGPGGIGKTRLALATAQCAEAELRGQVWLIELAGIALSSEVCRAVGDTLGIRETPGRSLTQSIVADLQSRRALLVLDNCEHVIDGAAELAHAVAEGCPDVHVLATSREGLGLVSEQLIVVTPLEPAGPGVELFNERALAVDRSFDLATCRDDVEEICRRLDGVPLAIELAAARTRTLAPSDLLDRLDDHLRLLTGGRRTSVERHRTLRATIQWSYELLSPPERALYRILSIFVGSFDLSAAETVASEVELEVVDVDELIGGLIERSMLIVESGPFGRRFRLLETMRQFGAERLYETGDTDVIAQRHAQWCVEQVTHINLLLRGRGEIEGVARLGELWPNLRAAFDWACAIEDYELAYALVRPVVLEASLRSEMEVTDWVERLLVVTPAENKEIIAFALTWASHRYTRNRDNDAYVRLVGSYGELDDPLVSYALAMVARDTPEMTRWAGPVVAKLREQGDDYMAEFYEIGGTGGTLMMTERFEELDAHIAVLLDRYQAEGPSTFLNWALVMSGFAALLQGKQAEANMFFEESARVDLPYGTDSLNKPIEARGELRRGRHKRAFQILRSCVSELDDLDAHRDLRVFACVEFTTMMTTIDDMPDAARMLGHLETTDLFETPVFKELVSEVIERIAASDGTALDEQRILGTELDERQALDFMTEVLDRLIAEG